MIKLAIIGSRNYPKPLLVKAFVKRLALRMGSVEIISGGARGVDTWAAEEARANNLPLHVYPADWITEGNRAGIIRNSQIVRLSNVVVAFWDLESCGSRDTITKALAWKKRVKVFGPDGKTLTSDELAALLKKEVTDAADQAD